MSITDSAIRDGTGLILRDRCRATILRTTIAGNAASNLASNTSIGAGPGGLSIDSRTARVTLRATIISGNAYRFTPEDCGSTSPIRLVGPSLIGTDGCGGWLRGTGSLIAGDPQLGRLQDNGGPTETVALGEGSSAIGAITRRVDCADADQRGVPRAVPCDVGAYEAP